MSERALDTCGCCAPEPARPAIENRPALAEIAYRIGTYGTFRAAMLRELSRRPELRGWTARSSNDYGIALLELWAYVADVLTFYQERIANEAFLRTARQPESLVNLARLLDYRPAPGVAAAAEITFRLERDKQVDLPARMRVQSVPARREEKPQTFETGQTAEAFSDFNELRLRAIRPVGDPLHGGDTDAVVRGSAVGVDVGAYILVVGEERAEDPGSERWDVRRVMAVKPDEEHDLTALELSRPLGSSWVFSPPAEVEQRLYAMRVQAWPFGYNAPDYNLIPETLRTAGSQYETSWSGAKLPHDPAHPRRLFLDDVYPDLVIDDWVILTTPEAVVVDGSLKPRGYSELYRIKRAESTVRSGYGLTGRVTRLDLDVPAGGTEPEHIDVFPLQGTTVLTRAAPLERVEFVTQVRDRILELDGAFPELGPEKRLLLVGIPVGADEEEVEPVTVRHAQVVNSVPPHTRVELVLPLSTPYQLESVRLYGNLARATHGETVRDEVIGSGDASRTFQSFQLAKGPLTFVSRPGGRQGVAAELEIRVDGVLWHEVPTFYGSGPDDRVYIVRIDAAGKSSVRFGDGLTGARLPTGRNNVLATYRHGLGSVGNVAAGAVRTLLDRPVGVRSANNPAPTGIGVDPEASELTRLNIPNTVRTFGRIVSLPDFEDAARETAVVAKARATWEWDGEIQAVHLTVAGAYGLPIVGDALEGLVADLDARRDPNRKLVVRAHVPVPVEVEAVVRVHPDYLARDVVAGARTALRDCLSFDSLQFGQPVHLSDTYRVLQNVPGVVSVDIDTLRFKPFGTAAQYAGFVRQRGGTFHLVGSVEQPDAVQAHLLLRGSELAVLQAPADGRVREA